MEEEATVKCFKSGFFKSKLNMNLPYVAGKYALLRKIASGGMAEVFLAKHIGLDGFEKLVVLKRILPHLASQREYVSMFLDEAKTAADLRHSNVVNTFEFGEDKGVYFMVMEFLHGQDLRSIYRKALQTKMEIPLKHSLGIIIDACCGLYYAHSKKDMNGQNLAIVHRDISPQNIVVTYEGETKIVDFGIAKAAHQNVETASGVLKGKYSYMSPEQALGHGADHRTDIFALGIVLYEMTTWRRLFKKNNDISTLKAVLAC
ncbi:MAG: serine/threonine-protein kinase, partial [bacterium]|nr:serine/threonine-protein kinase [bacterium]